MSEIAASPHDTPYENTVLVRRRGDWSAARVARWVLLALGGLLLLAVLLVAALNTSPGRRFVVGQIEALEFENGLKIGVGRIDGSLYGAMTLQGLTLSDPRGVFLAIPTAQLDWRPFSYLDTHVDIRSLTAATATLRRLPAFRVAPPDTPLLPDLDISIARLKVDRLVIERSVTGEQRVAFINGRVRIADRRAQVALQAAAIGGDGRSGGDRLALNLDAVPEANKLALNLFLNAPRGGVFATMAGLEAPISVRVQGRGDWRKWDGRLRADLDGAQFACALLGSKLIRAAR